MSPTRRRSGDAPVQQRPDSQLMNIYPPFVLRVLAGEAEVLDHEQMKPCNQSVIQAAVKVKGCTLHTFKRASASTIAASYSCGGVRKGP